MKNYIMEIYLTLVILFIALQCFEIFSLNEKITKINELILVQQKINELLIQLPE